jgi:hypothetical protein
MSKYGDLKNVVKVGKIRGVGGGQNFAKVQQISHIHDIK